MKLLEGLFSKRLIDFLLLNQKSTILFFFLYLHACNIIYANIKAFLYP